MLAHLGLLAHMALLTDMAFLTDTAFLRKRIDGSLVVPLDGRHSLSTEASNANFQSLETRLVDLGGFHEIGHFFLDEREVFTIIFLLGKSST